MHLISQLRKEIQRKERERERERKREREREMKEGCELILIQKVFVTPPNIRTIETDLLI